MINESVFSSDSLVIPMADVQHIEKLTTAGQPNGLWAITKHTRWNFERDMWDNPIFIPERLAESFMEAWCRFRHEKDRVGV